jgi:hypothetical protein
LDFILKINLKKNLGQPFYKATELSIKNFEGLIKCLFYMIKLLIRWLYFLLTNSQSCTVLFCSLFYVGNVDAILHRKYVVHLSTHWEGSFILWRSILELGGWTCPCSWCFFIIDVGPVLSPMPISVLSRFLIVPCACFLWCFCSSGMITVPPPPPSVNVPVTLVS